MKGENIYREEEKEKVKEGRRCEAVLGLSHGR